FSSAKMCRRIPLSGFHHAVTNFSRNYGLVRLKSTARGAAMPPIKLNDPRYYLNRHVQWLDFNRRVLPESRDPANPPLERVKFLAITANNLDEFVEVRVSSFLQRIEHGSTEPSP